MGSYVVPTADMNDVGSLMNHLQEKGAWNDQQVWDAGIEEGGVLFIDSTRTDQECADLYSDWQHVDNWQPPLSPQVRAEAVRIKQSAQRTDAQLDSAFPAGPTRELAYAVRATCRALIYLVERRLED